MTEKTILDILWVAVCAVLVFLMQPGFLCLESGLTRSKNNINVAIKNLSDVGVAVFVFFVFGFGLMLMPALVGPQAELGLFARLKNQPISISSKI